MKKRILQRGTLIYGWNGKNMLNMVAEHDIVYNSSELLNMSSGNSSAESFRYTFDKPYPKWNGQTIYSIDWVNK